MKRKELFFILILFIMSSCKVYKEHIMFKTNESIIVNENEIKNVESKYIIQPNDILEIKVFSNNGEILIDPDNILKQELGISNTSGVKFDNQYLVKDDGIVKLPIVGDLIVGDLNFEEAQNVLEKEFSEMYNDAFVTLKLLNRRVVVFGPTGGKVIPLENENMNLLEVLALANAATTQIKAENIRLIRGDLTNPNVVLIDLSTIDGMMQANLMVKANDVIYVETKRNVFRETLSTITPIMGMISSVITLVFLFGRF